ncbi:hypothetical protein [Candidatus Tisiphia endosymbiont of Sialis lutaria]|uniref:hypothetical protein n=1 Tax=Candidatus Tisiphia endosymbiont of Sialis lutaria TaxID=2029164 RepID=UPI00312CB263
MTEIGYSSVNAKIIKPKFTKEQNEYLQLDLDSIASLLEKFQLITNNDIQSLKAKLTIEQNA